MQPSLDFKIDCYFRPTKNLYHMDVVITDELQPHAERHWEHASPDVLWHLARVFILSASAALFSPPETVEEVEHMNIGTQLTLFGEKLLP